MLGYVSSAWKGLTTMFSSSMSSTEQPDTKKQSSCKVRSVADKGMNENASFIPEGASRMVKIDGESFIALSSENTSQKEIGVFGRTIARGKEQVFEEFKTKKPDQKRSATIEKHLKSLGTQEITVTTASNKKEVFSHLKASDFAAKLNAAGAKKATLSVGDVSVPAITFDPKNSKDVKDALVALGIMSGSRSQGLWASHTIAGVTYIVDEAGEAALQKAALSKNLNTTHFKGAFSSEELIFKANKTMVMSGGILSYRNSGRQSNEMFQYLLRGMDVVFLDDKENLDSESVANSFEKRDAIMQYLTNDLGIKNENIIINGTCFSGIPATYMAANYPGTGLLLNQAYTNMHAIATDKDNIQEGSFWDWAYKTTLNRAGLSHKMEDAVLDAIKGPVCVMVNTNDKTISMNRSAEVVSAIPKNSIGGKVIEIDDEQFQHADLWSNNKNATAGLEQYLDDYHKINEDNKFFAQQRIKTQ